MTKRKDPEDFLKTGRPSPFGPKILTSSREYIESCKDGYFPQLVEEHMPIKKGGKSRKIFKMVYRVQLPSIEGLSVHLGVSRDTIYEWERLYPVFSDILDDLRAKQGLALINNSLSGNYSSPIAKVLLSKHGYVEKTETETKLKGLGELLDQADEWRKTHE